MHVAPGDPIDYLVGREATGVNPEFVKEIRAKYYLDRPLFEQYFIYLVNVFKGDWGTSIYYNVPVYQLIIERVPATLLLTVTGFIFSVILGISAGVIASRKPYSIVDYVITTLSTMGYSIPDFWLGMMLIIIVAVQLNLLPAGGMFSPMGASNDFADVVSHLILPAAALATVQTAYCARLTRGTMLEELGKDYIITARSKGLSERTVFFKHALMNSIIPVITYLGLQIRHLFSGAIMIEIVFSWPGIGRLWYGALLARDYPVVMGVFVIITILVMVSMLISDLLYAFFDPRVKYE
jgi:peptide/nickel transport system permease protein